MSALDARLELAGGTRHPRGPDDRLDQRPNG